MLRLFVAGMTARSTRAVENIRAICEEHFAGAYELEVVNLYEQPARASGEQIIAAPTCVKELRFPPAASSATCRTPRGSWRRSTSSSTRDTTEHGGRRDGP